MITLLASLLGVHRRAVMAGAAIAFAGSALIAIEVLRGWERAKIEADRNADYIETRQDMDNADIGTGDADADRDWLRGAAERLHGAR